MTETGWLIEAYARNRTVWWTGRTMQDDQSEWTVDSLEAVRFARREDAERVIERLPIQLATAVEHMWVMSVTETVSGTH